MKVDGCERVHGNVVEELKSGPPLQVRDILGEYDVEGRGEHQVHEDEDHQRVEVARTPEQGKKHEGQKTSNHL